MLEHQHVKYFLFSKRLKIFSLRMRETEEMLTKKIDFLEKQHEEQMKIVKANGTANKRIALAALKKAKRLEKQREQIDSTLSTLESQREILENASTNAEVLKMMKLSSDALKHAQDHMSLNKVEDLMDDVREQQEIAEEIANVIQQATPFATSNQDEEELLKASFAYGHFITAYLHSYHHLGT